MPRLPLSLTAGLVAASLAYLAAGVLWRFAEVGFPFGPEQDPLGDEQSLLGAVDHAEAWPYVIALAALGLLTAAALRRPASGALSRLVTVLSAAQGVLYAVVLPDGRPLVAAAHVPVLIAGKPFGWPPDVTISSQLPWPVVHQMILMVVGGAWIAATILHARVARGACVRCGRTAIAPRWAEPEQALRWGRWAVWVAMAAPASYASSRLAWALDIPYGVTPLWLDEMRADEPTIFVGGAAIALLGLGGAALTFGLVAGWGERWPRWIPRLRGRAVPHRVAIIPSLVVAALLVSAGKGWYVSATLGHLPEEVFGPQWATVIFGSTLPPWGIALGVAAYAYWLRRRGACARCGRGGPAPELPACRALLNRSRRTCFPISPRSAGSPNGEASTTIRERPRWR
jgi:hypothetical protein